MNAIILVGGEGVRLRPYTENTPKPMLKVGGKPIIHWLVQQLDKAGVNEIVLMENYLSHIIKEYFDSSVDIHANIIHLTDKHSHRGTSDLIKDASKSLSHHGEDIIIMAGDTLIDMDYSDFTNYHTDGGALITIAARREKLPHGIFECNDDNKVIHVREKPSVIIPTATMIINSSVVKNVDKNGDFFFNIVPYIESSGAIFEVDAERVIHISERRDDLLLANERWLKIRQQEHFKRKLQ